MRMIMTQYAIPVPIYENDNDVISTFIAAECLTCLTMKIISYIKISQEIKKEQYQISYSWEQNICTLLNHVPRD